MSKFAKKYPFIFGIFVISVVFFIACVVTYVITSSANDKKEKELSTLVRQYNNLKNSSITPLPKNITKVKANINELEAHLEEMYQSLISQSSAITDQNMKGISLLGEIQGFIIDSEKKAESGIPSNDPSEKKHVINLKENEAFGFAQYSGETARPPADEIAPMVNKQLDILRFLVKHLYAAKPTAIVAIEREPVTQNKSSDLRGQSNNSNTPELAEDLFEVPASITAAVPGNIETTGFKIVFQGHTNSLRTFLNLIADFELPIVVREVEVKSIESSAALGSNTNRRSRSSSQEDIFNELFGGGNSSNTDQPSKEVSSQYVPIVQDILSEFSIMLEYIDIVSSEGEVEEEGI